MDILSRKDVKTQKIGKTTYVFIDKPYWDKEKKQNRHEREYIGKLNENGHFVPNKEFAARYESEKGEEASKNNKNSLIAERKFFGATYLLDKISEKSSLNDDLIASVGEELGQKIMSLAYFLVLEGESSMYRFEKFAKTHKHPFGKIIASQRISEIFADISETKKLSFFKKRATRVVKNEYLAYDTTSISSYSEMMKQIKYGKNKDLEELTQLNLAMVFGEESMLPVYYRKLPGNISDVSTMKKLLIDMSFMNLKKMKFVLDRGFFSAANINELYRNRHKFIIATKSNSAKTKVFLAEIKVSKKGLSNFDSVHDVYFFTKLEKWRYEFTNRKGEKSYKNRLIYFHGYYDGVRAEDEKLEFIKNLKFAETCFKEESANETQKRLIEEYFFLDKDSKIIGENHQALNAKMESYGYFILLSSHESNAVSALSIYRNKDVIEKTFCNLKNRLDMKRTKVSTEESLEGKLFVQFIALTFVSYIHQIMIKNDLYKNYSMSSLLDELDVIEIFEYSSKKTHYSEITKKQRKLLAYFGLTL